MHEHSIVNDLAWILFTAAVAALALHPFKIPLLIGYIVAGFLVGPHLGLWPALVELENVQELSELGVIFLLFYIGLEFDFGRLKRLIGPAFTALALQTLLMLFLGIEASRLLGLSVMDGWFLGGLFSISSSMVSVKLIRERGLIHRPHASLTIGVLVLEDILAILLLVLLAGMAAEGTMNVQAIGRSLLFIAIFTVLVFLIGKLGALRLTRFLVVRGTTELVTMAALGLIFLVGLLAYKFNFSWALGGFLAGAILSRSQLAEKIEQLTEPLRDLFSDYSLLQSGCSSIRALLLRYAPIIIVLSLVIIIGKFSSCWLGFFLAGRDPSEATRAALIKSQIGEFSFVIVSIGATHGATSSELQSIVSGVAFITILTTPTLIQNENRVLSWGKRFLAESHKRVLLALWTVDRNGKPFYQSQFTCGFGKKASLFNLYPFLYNNWDNYWGRPSVATPHSSRIYSHIPEPFSTIGVSTFRSRQPSLPRRYHAESKCACMAILGCRHEQTFLSTVFQWGLSLGFQWADSAAFAFRLWDGVFASGGQLFPYRICIHHLSDDHWNRGMDILEESHTPASSLGNRDHQINEK